MYQVIDAGRRDLAVQFAKAMGATVIVTSSSDDDKLERARALGADHAVNYKSERKSGKAVLGTFETTTLAQAHTGTTLA